MGYSLTARVTGVTGVIGLLGILFFGSRNRTLPSTAELLGLGELALPGFVVSLLLFFGSAYVFVRETEE